MDLFSHPFSSYCQKALIAFYENGIPFQYRLLAPEEPDTLAEFAGLWPLGKFPVLRDGQRTVVEATIIIEYLDLQYPGPVRLVPADPRAALEVRMLDRFFDNYVMSPMQKVVADCLRPAGHKDSHGVTEARQLLDRAYGWLESHLGDREWVAGDGFTLADCAAAPALFYADWVQPVGAGLGRVRAYRQRLLARPSFARAVDEARPYRSLFPPGAPDRD